tara:strand:- start:134 stop:682 length:549 start_codon:yes stop_codon:yes gene_type:complete
MNETKKAIYEMLTESTGEHFLDSGGDDGRHWQQNQKKTLSDFESEPYEIIEDEGTDYPYRELSVFHHLTRTLEYQETKTEDFNRWIAEEERENNLCDAEDYLSEFYAYHTTFTNSCNEDCDLSQVILFVEGKRYVDDLILLSIHNGADVRGGYTDYRIFKVIDESFYHWYEDSDSIKERATG